MILTATFASTGTRAAEDRAVTIAALGDSTTAGTPFFLSPLESPPDGKGDPEGQYGYWIEHDHPDWTVVNLGVRGQRSDEIRARFEDAFQSSPQYVVILAGINDIYQGSSLNEACKNLEWMYRQTKFKNVMPIAATIPPFDRATPEQSELIAKVNRWILEAAEQHNIPVVDLHTLLADPKEPTHLNGSSDGLHPDIGGYRQMGKAIGALIQKLESARPPTN